MTAEGKLKEVGIPEAEKPQIPATPKDSVKPEQTKNISSPDGSGKSIAPQDEETTKKEDIGGDLPTPMPVPFVPTIF